MTNPSLLTAALLAVASPCVGQTSPQSPAQTPSPTPKHGVDLDDAPRPSFGESLRQGRIDFGDWIDRFDVSGFASVRYFQTEDRGSRPDGAFGIDQATVFVDAGVRDVGSVFFEVRVERFYDADTTGVTTGELYLSLPEVCKLGEDGSLSLRVGRFDLPFGEWYELEDAHLNRMIGYPIALPYQFDEGVEVIGDLDGWGFVFAVSDGTRSRNSRSGIGPGFTGRLHWQPTDGFYTSVSGHYVHEADVSALGFNAMLITPVQGSATGTSPSAEVRSTVGCQDVVWQVTEQLHLQTQVSAARVADDDEAFSRTFYWWTVEPSFALTSYTAATLRYSGAGTFDDQEGYRFEGRPYGNGTATYGFDLRSMERLAVCLSHTFTPGLVGKAEVGFDHTTATDVSGRPNDTRNFVALELVLAF